MTWRMAEIMFLWWLFLWWRSWWVLLSVSVNFLTIWLLRHENGCLLSFAWLSMRQGHHYHHQHHYHNCLVPIAYRLLPVCQCSKAIIITLPIAHCLLPYSYYLLPIAYYPLPFAYSMPTTRVKMTSKIFKLVWKFHNSTILSSISKNIIFIEPWPEQSNNSFPIQLQVCWGLTIFWQLHQLRTAWANDGGQNNGSKYHKALLMGKGLINLFATCVM